MIKSPFNYCLEGKQERGVVEALTAQHTETFINDE